MPTRRMQAQLTAKLISAQTSDSVESYNLKTNEWTFVSSMAESHYGHAGTVHGDMLYISGNADKNIRL